MKLLNYTTKIDADKTAAEIVKILAANGASAILTDYKDGVLSAISFKIIVNTQSMGFRLPCDWRPVYDVLLKQKKLPNTWDSRYERAKSEREMQAVRTAWRIVKDWVEAQMALVQTRMVETQDVFLPYMVLSGGQTLVERMRDDSTFLLGPGQ